MIEILAATASQPIRWEEIGLSPGIDLGFFQLRYYSLAYLIGIILGWWHLSKMARAPGSPMAQRHVDDLFFYCTLGIILGGRLGYAAFYNPDLWLGWTDSEFVKWDLLRLWDGGMSFHGGVLGVLTAIAWVTWRNQLSFIRVCDYIAVNVGFGMLLGRVANFINGELWGRAAGPDVPWAMIFPGDPLGLARHPSQLYQAALEGALVIAVMLPLFWMTRARFRPGLLVSVFTVLIGAARFIGEFYREPDAQLAEFAVRTGLSMGQWLSIPLILAGLAVALWALRRPPLAAGSPPPSA